MEIPKNTTLYEHPMATFWFDKNGILYSVSKDGSRTIELMDDYIAFVKSLTNNERVCIVTDISKAGPMDKKNRDYAAVQLQKVYKAMAIITKTRVGEMIGKVFLQLEDQPYPTAMFTEEKDAIEWVKQYL
jgi:hypothetical protein